VALSHAIMLAAMHWIGLASAYIPLALILPYIIVMTGLFPRKNLIALFAFLHAPSAILGTPNSFGTLGVFLGLLGRSGAGVPSDRTAAIIISIFYLLYFLPTFAAFAASQTKLALRRVRGIASLIIIATASVAFFMPLVYGTEKSAVYSYNAPKRLIVSHFHAPQQSPPTIIGFVPLDVIPFDGENTMKALDTDMEMNTRGIKKLDSIPVFGEKNLETDIGEPFRPYKKFLSAWSTFQVDEIPPLEVPHAEILDEREDGDGKFVNVTVKVRAKDSMQLSIRIPNDNSIVKWSLKAPLKADESSWVRHIGRGKGAEQIVFSVLVRRRGSGEQQVSDVQKGRDKVQIVVSSYRSQGAGGIESNLLRRLKFEPWVSPTIAFTTGSSFKL